jgi:hypothetical protein
LFGGGEGVYAGEELVLVRPFSSFPIFLPFLWLTLLFSLTVTRTRLRRRRPSSFPSTTTTTPVRRSSELKDDEDKDTKVYVVAGIERSSLY